MPADLDLPAPNAPKRRREHCPYCGAEDYACESPFECQREIEAEERAQMEREIEEVRERHGYY